MKRATTLLAGLAALTITTAGFAQTILGSYDFETGAIASWFKNIRGSGASDFSLTPSIVAEPGNRYGHYVVTTTNLASNPSARWYAGSITTIPIISVNNPPPPHWKVSFDIRQQTLEPVFVELVLGSFSFPSPSSTTWVTPLSAGWSHVEVFSEQFTQGVFGAGEYPTELEIGMSSHDGNGQPLAIASVGSHAFDIDNIVMSVVPEPSSSALIVFGLLAVAYASRTGKLSHG